MQTRHTRRAARAFTLIELMIVVVIVAVLTALVFFAVGAAVRAVKKAGEQQYLRALATAVEQYKQNTGSVPPLVAEGPDATTGPLVVNPAVGPARPRFKGEDPNDLARAVRFMRYEVDADVPNTDRQRYSRYTLSIYVLGLLGKKYDGVDGPGFTKADSDGVFTRAGSATQPLFDMSRAPERIKRDPYYPSAISGEDDEMARTVLVDRWGTPIRYYRWLPTYHTANTGAVLQSVYPGAAGNTPGLAKEVRSYNIPPGVGNPLINTELRSAVAAIVSAGPDGQINDANADAPENQDNLVEVIK